MPKSPNKKILFSKIRLHLWRWHRRMGLLSALFVLLLAVTGILLNHGNRLGLDANVLPPSWLAFFYGIEAPTIVSLEVNGNVISQVGGEQLFFNDGELGDCGGELLGAIPVDGLLVVGCGNAVFLLTGDGELVDQLSEVNGLPTPLTAIGECQQGLCFQWQQDQYYVFDSNTMQWRAGDGPLQSALTSVTTPPSLRQRLVRRYGGTITWERWLQDLHSGRLLGAIGPWLMDLMAVLFIALAVTGVVMWSLGRRKRA